MENGELVKKLRVASVQCDEMRLRDFGYIMKTASEAIPQWISVEERLPEEDEVVLVWGGASVYTAKRHNKYGCMMWWKLNSKQHYCNPTHWMPIPEPPKEVDT